MRKMHRWFLILLVLCLALIFVGCSNPIENQEENNEYSTDEMKSINLELLPEDANLSEATGVVVEPKKPPYNLGGWTEDSTVFWDVELPQDGKYEFKINYSRPGQFPEAWGIIRVETADGRTTDLNFRADPTGKIGDNDDWAVYTNNDGIGANFTSGKARISVIPDFDEDYMSDYFINLRYITMTCTPKEDNSTDD